MYRIFLLFFLFNYGYSKAQIPANYIRSYGSAGSDGGVGVCHDINGNVYATGYFSGSMMADSSHYLNAQGGSDIYILKNDVNGILIWAIRAGGTGLDRPMDIACDGAGNIYITGFCSSNAHFDTQTLTSYGLQDFFIAKYDAGGNLLWVHSGGGTVQDEGKKLDVDVSGNCVVTGTFSGTASFGSTTLNSVINLSTGIPSIDVFIAFYSPSGNLVWLKQGSSEFTDQGTGITIDGLGSIYVSGQFSDTISFTSTYPNVMYNSAFLMKLDYSGNELWFRKIGGGIYNFIQDVGINSNGKILSTGYFRGTPFIDVSPPQLIQVNHDYGVFMIQWDPNGTFEWIQTFGSECYVDGRSISFDDSSNIFLGGNFKCRLEDFSITYGEGAFNSVGFQDVYLAKFDPSGNLSWARNFGGQLEDYLNDISINLYNQPLITGKYENRMMFPVLLNQSFNLLSYGFVGLPSAYLGGSCNELQDWRMFQVASKGKTDAFLAKPYHPAIGPYYYYYNYGDSNCSRPFIKTEISFSHSDDRAMNVDTLVSCLNITMTANSNTSRVISQSQQPLSSPGPRFTYLWSTGETTRDIQVTQSGTFWVRITSIDSCFTSSDTVVYVKNPSPQKPKMSDSQGVNVMADTTQILYLCKPDSLEITVHSDSTYQLLWNTIPAINDSTSITITNANNYLTNYNIGTINTIYQCRVFNEFGCLNSNYIRVIIDTSLAPIQPRLTFYNPNTGLPLLSDTIRMCDENSFEIIAGIYDTLIGIPPGMNPCYDNNFIKYSTYSWSMTPVPIGSTGFSCDQTNVFSVDSGGWYTANCVMIRESPCPGMPVDTFIFQKSIYLLIDPVPVISATITGDTFLCQGDSILLVGSGGPYFQWYFNYSWQQVLISTQPQVYVLDTGEYYLFVSDTNQFGCIARAVDILEIHGPAQPSLNVFPTNALLCPGDSISISCTASGNYTWYGPNGVIGTNASVIYVSQPGLYYCELDSSGCFSTSMEVEVTGYATPVLTVTPSQVLCPGENVMLELFVSNGSIVQWSAPLSGSALQQTISQPGIYTCQVVSCGITTVVSTEIVVSSVSAAIQPAGPISICAGSEVTLTANPGMAFYFWQPQIAFSPVLITNMAGNYFLMTTDAYGCNAFSDTVEINLLPEIIAPVISSNSPVCSGDTLTISATNDSILILQWTMPDGSQSFDSSITYEPVMTSASGIYIATLSNGVCTISDSIIIVVDSLIYSGITTNGTGCIGTPFHIQTIPETNTSYNWTTPDNGNQSGFEINFDPLLLTDKGLYIIEIAAGDCNMRDSILIAPEDCIDELGNVFSPNGDGLNDTFIFADLPVNGYAVVIDRWGKKVFETDSQQKSWDGTSMHTGHPCSAGTYFYIIKVPGSGKTDKSKGCIQLFR